MKARGPMKVGVCVAMTVVACLVAGGSPVGAGKPVGVLVIQASNEVIEATADGDHSLVVKPVDPSSQDLVDSSVSPDGQQLALVVEDGDTYKLELRGLQGDGQVWQIWKDKQFVDEPVWSPDSRYVAFTFDFDHLVVTGRHAQKIATVASSVTGYAWSPDGQTLAFTTGTGVWVYAPATGAARTLATVDGASKPSWGAGGQAVVYLNSHHQLVLTPLAGRSRTITGIYDYVLSPDGTSLAYWTKRWFGVRSLGPGAKPRRIAPAPLVFNAGWSPDSGRLAFSRAQEDRGPARIYAVRTGGGPVRALTPPDPDGRSLDPVFSPDGSKLAFTESSAGDYRVRVLDLRTGTVIRLLPNDPNSSVNGPVGWTTPAVSLPATERGTNAVFAGSLTARDPVSGLAADGGQAAALANIESAVGYSTWTELLWSPLAGSHAEPLLACHYDVADLVVAGGRIGYSCDDGTGPSIDDLSVYLATFGQTNAPDPAFWAPCCVFSLAGSRSLLVEASQHDLNRVNPDGRLTLIRSFPNPIRALGVSDNRVLIDAGDGVFGIVDSDGSLGPQFSLPHGNGAKLDGGLIAAIDNRTLRITGILGGAVTQRTVPAGAQLEAISGQTGTVAYTDGNRQHLLSSDGKDVTVNLPGQYGPAWAASDNDGSLYYAYNTRWPTSSKLLYLQPAQLQEMFRR